MSSFDNEYLRGIGRFDSNLNSWSGTLSDYLQIVRNNPRVAQLSVQRLYNMVLSHGVKKRPDGKNEYLFFKNKVFGAENEIEEIMFYLKAASQGLDIKKRVLLLLGPPGGGKSQIVALFKKGLADYTHTSEGAIYAIEGCPIHEDPLHIIPDKERPNFKAKYGVKIEGKLCPHCQFRYENEWEKNIANIKVERMFLSEENRNGVGTFAPAEKNDMSELYGSANTSKSDYYGSEADARAYSFDGELHTANRGIMEFIEVLKAKPDFLHVLLTLAEEQQFKTPRFPLQYVDETLLAHTNESEFLKFIANPENSAVLDRMYIVRMPYNLKVENEELIYHFAMKTKLVSFDKKITDGAINFASEFAILTRQHENDLRRGMDGISPRFILNALGIALVKVDKKVIDSRDFLIIIRDLVYNNPIYSNERRKFYLEILYKLNQKHTFYDTYKCHYNMDFSSKPLSNNNNFFNKTMELNSDDYI